MTKDKALKREIRKVAQEKGISYTAARRLVLAGKKVEQAEEDQK